MGHKSEAVATLVYNNFADWFAFFKFIKNIKSTNTISHLCRKYRHIGITHIHYIAYEVPKKLQEDSIVFTTTSLTMKNQVYLVIRCKKDFTTKKPPAILCKTYKSRNFKHREGKTPLVYNKNVMSTFWPYWQVSSQLAIEAPSSY